MLFLRTVVSTALVFVGAASALPLTARTVEERQLSALVGLLPELGPILDGLLGDILRRDEHTVDRRQLGGGGLSSLSSLGSLTSLLGGLGGSGADGKAGTTGAGQVAGASGNARPGKSTPGSGLDVRQVGSSGGLGSLLGGRDIVVGPRQISGNGSPGLDGILGELAPLLGGGLGGGALRRDEGALDPRQLDGVTGLLSALEPLLKGLGL
ncbi:unnamed protein product [Peniophora sp. CBMAI 1063]|nr:unnamed protein product [Peniophora sp. CBMAI 1063]